jgi:hypothetical protein
MLVCIVSAPAHQVPNHGNGGHGRPECGARVWPGSALITLPDLSAFKVTTQVSEAIVGSLRVGQRVTVTFPRIDAVEFSGEIMHIDVWGQDRSQLLDDTGKEAEGLYGTKVYRVEVRILETDDRLNLGIKARVRFPAGSPAAAPDPAIRACGWVEVKEGLSTGEGVFVRD